MGFLSFVFECANHKFFVLMTEDSSVANAYAVYVTLRARSQNQLPTPPQ